MTDQTHLRFVLTSQYRASLEMLIDAIEKYPEEEWLSSRFTNAGWQLAYHTLYFTEYYSRLNWEDFTPWLTHGIATQNDDGIAGPPDPNSTLPLIPEPFTKEQVSAYAKHCFDIIGASIDAMDLTSPESGFYWYKVSKIEHQIISIRHLQHGAAQLADRVRTMIDVGVKWIGRSHPVSQPA